MVGKFFLFLFLIKFILEFVDHFARELLCSYDLTMTSLLLVALVAATHAQASEDTDAAGGTFEGDAEESQDRASDGEPAGATVDGICGADSTVRGFRHHSGPHLTCSPATCHPSRAVWCALLGGHAYGMLIGACHPMLRPIFRRRRVPATHAQS